MAQTARISIRSNSLIEEITFLTGKNKVDIIESALESYRHIERMRLFNESYQRLRNNKKAWKQEQKERKELEGTFGDGLTE